MRRVIIATILIVWCATVCAGQMVLVTAKTSLSLRKSPSKQATRIVALPTHEPVEVLQRKDATWAKVKTAEGKVGWVLSRYLSKTGFVSIKLQKANVRRGPSTKYAIVMELGRHWPLRVLDVASNGWLKVQDYEGDRGWVSPSIVVSDPVYVIATLETCNVRRGIGTEHPVAFTCEKGVILKVLDEQKGWLKVRHTDGDTGWMSAKIVFGWLRPE